jgi:hypothetical protein
MVPERYLDALFVRGHKILVPGVLEFHHRARRDRVTLVPDAHRSLTDDRI